MMSSTAPLPPLAPPAPRASLEYAPGSPLRRRKRIRRIVILLLLLGVGLAAWRWWPAARDQARLLYWQRQCMNFQFPPDVILYEKDPAKAAVLLSRPNSEYIPLPFYGHPNFSGYQLMITQAVYQPRCLREFEARIARPLDPGSRSIVFCHQRRTPAGKPRLVIVYTTPWSDFGPLWEWELHDPAGMISTPKPPSSGADPVVRGMGGGFSIPTRLGPGQPDPADPTHFTLPLFANGQPIGVYDGRLTDDDKIIITQRPGPLKP